MQEETCAKMAERVKSRRISKNQKTEIVLAVLRGESIEELSRTNSVAVYQIAKWRDVEIFDNRPTVLLSPMKKFVRVL